METMTTTAPAPSTGPATTLSAVTGFRFADLHVSCPGGSPSGLTELWRVIDTVRAVLAEAYTELEYRHAELWLDIHGGSSLLGAATSLQKERSGADPFRPQVWVIPHRAGIYVYDATGGYREALAGLERVIDLSYGPGAEPMTAGLAHARSLLWAQVLPAADPVAVDLQVHVPATAGLSAVIAAEQATAHPAPKPSFPHPRWCR